MTERRQVQLSPASDAWSSEPSDPIADMLAAATLPYRPAPPFVFTPAQLVNLERCLGEKTTFDGPTPAAVLAARAR